LGLFARPNGEGEVTIKRFVVCLITLALVLGRVAAADDTTPLTLVTVRANPNPAVIGGPLEVRVDFENLGEPFTGQLALYIIAFGFVGRRLLIQ
jgi:hypothetical protein